MKNAFQADNISLTKNIVRDLCPGGRTDFEAVIRDGTRVAMYKTAEGAVNTCMLIYKLLSYANDMLNVYKPMTGPQMEDLAEEFMQELHWVTMEDLAVFFMGIPKQYWGHINNRFDAPVVWELWDVYATRRNEFLWNRETQHKAGEEKARPKKPDEKFSYTSVGDIADSKEKWLDQYKKQVKK